MPLAKTAYLAIVQIVFDLKFHFSVKCLDPKARKTFKTECYVHPFRTVFSWKLYFFQITLSIDLHLQIKHSADQILTMTSDFLSFEHLRVAIRLLSNN